MYWKVPVCLKCVFTSRIAFSLNLVRVLVSDISAGNLIVGWCKFACSKKLGCDV